MLDKPIDILLLLSNRKAIADAVLWVVQNPIHPSVLIYLTNAFNVRLACASSVYWLPYKQQPLKLPLVEDSHDERYELAQNWSQRLKA